MGDAAVLMPLPDADSNVLHVKVGSAWLTLTAFGPDGPDRYAEVLQALARHAIQRVS